MTTADNYRAAGMRAPREATPEVAPTVPDYPSFTDGVTSSGPDDSWTVADLRSYAQARSIDLTGASVKADVLAAITAHADADTEEQS